MTKFYIGVRAVILSKGKALLIKKTEERKHIWDLPGGIIEFTEEPEDGLHRVIREETGLEIKEIDSIMDASKYIDDNDDHILWLTYLCEPTHTRTQLAEGHNEHRWIAPTEIDFEFRNRPVRKIIDKLLRA